MGKLKDQNKKIKEENKELKVSIKLVDETADKISKDTVEGQLKIKDMEIKSLTFTRKVSMDNALKLQRINLQLESKSKNLK